MTRYIDVDLIPYSGDDDYLSQYAYRYDINEVPTADVVPKSEYDNLKWQFDILDAECSRLERYESKVYEEVIKAKSEVAGEIFEEIEKSCRTFGVWGISGYLMKDIDNLKKKYTEEKK